ncbi:VOC family protein [Brevibacterium aurantiacum]|uniref:VOC family protein n=1 Tax=Brevibacterium aurantiacum TaxID=273384 RepID=UPI001865E59D|nr:VOC family protein [Brevibacterium aurantiacum]
MSNETNTANTVTANTNTASTGPASTNTANIWPTFRYQDAKAAIAFLQDAFGFDVAAEYTNADDPQRIDHAELVWPEGGGIMLGSARDDGGVMTKTGVATGSVYVATDRVKELYHRAIEAGATEVMGLTEQDYGSLDFCVQDPEGVLWCFGTYRGAGAD